ACERGVVRVDALGSRIRQFVLDGAAALAPAPDGVWVGSVRGLFVVSDEGSVVRVWSDTPVLSLVAVRESVWVGTAGGLGLLAPGANTLAVPPHAAPPHP